MSSPERRWWQAKRTLGDALQENRNLTDRYAQTSERVPEIVNLAREGARTEAAFELARVNLDLALLKDRRARSAHDHATKMASLRGASPHSLPPYLPDQQLAEAQEAFDLAQSAHQAVERMLQNKGGEASAV